MPESFTVPLTDDGRGVGKTLKSSLLGKDTGYDALQRYYEGSRAALRRPGALEHTREVVAEALRSSASETEFRRRLAADGIDTVLRRNARGSHLRRNIHQPSHRRCSQRLSARSGVCGQRSSGPVRIGRGISAAEGGIRPSADTAFHVAVGDVRHAGFRGAADAKTSQKKAEKAFAIANADFRIPPVLLNFAKFNRSS